jgi:hypothetical protein
MRTLNVNKKREFNLKVIAHFNYRYLIQNDLMVFVLTSTA